MKTKLLKLLAVMTISITALLALGITASAETVGAFEVTGGTNGTDYTYADGVLTLHNYTVTERYAYESTLNGWGVPVSFDACIYSKDPLIIQLEGENFINSVGSEYMLDYINKRWGILDEYIFSVSKYNIISTKEFKSSFKYRGCTFNNVR